MIRKTAGRLASITLTAGMAALGVAGPAAAAAPSTPHGTPMRVSDGPAAPIHASNIEDCGTISNTPAPNTWINVCAATYRIGPDVYLDSQADFGRNATSATGCKITGYLRLANASGSWNGPKLTRDCTNALQNREFPQTYEHWRGFSSATIGSGRVCIDLYYGGSTHSGWQRCFDGSWTDL